MARGKERMSIDSGPGRTGQQISMKDTILSIPIGFSALLGFALSFSLFQPDGRPYVFGGCLIVYVVSLLFADKKRDLFLASLVFILLRLAWSAVITGIQASHPSGHH
jgi:hypothetical protein